jgi:hypothetical protein
LLSRGDVVARPGELVKPQVEVGAVFVVVGEHEQEVGLQLLVDLVGVVGRGVGLEVAGDG